LKIMQAHGHLAPQQALQILLEEMDLIPNLANTHDAQASAEALYYVARMADRCSGALGREISDDLRDALRDYSLETLKDLAQAFEMIQEKLLAQKIKTFVREQADHPRDRTASVALID